MTKILTGGVGKAEVVEKLHQLALPGIEAVASNDMDAAMALRSGTADYFLGTCHTGAGASLGVLVGLVGKDKTHTFGRSLPDAAEVEQLLDGGTTVFGFSIDQIDQLVPVIANAIRDRSA